MKSFPQPELRIAAFESSSQPQDQAVAEDVENSKLKMTRGGEEIQIKGIYQPTQVWGDLHFKKIEKIFLAFHSGLKPMELAFWGSWIWLHLKPKNLTDTILNEVILVIAMAWTPVWEWNPHQSSKNQAREYSSKTFPHQRSNYSRIYRGAFPK